MKTLIATASILTIVPLLVARGLLLADVGLPLPAAGQAARAALLVEGVRL
jgi:hypothetical protein